MLRYIQENSKIFRNIPNVQKYSKTFQNISKYSKTFQNIPEYARTFKISIKRLQNPTEWVNHCMTARKKAVPRAVWTGPAIQTSEVT